MRIIIIIAIIFLIAIAVLIILLLSGVLVRSQPIQSVSGNLPDKDCTTTDDCSVGACLGGKCLIPVGVGCLKPTDCQSGYCTGGICTAGVGGTCTTNFDCATNICDGTCKLGLYSKCTTSSQCTNGLICSLGACSTPTGNVCSSNNECQNRLCSNQTCVNLQPIFELTSGTDIMFSTDINEASPIFSSTGYSVDIYPAEATGLTPLVRCYYPSLNVHSVGVDKCPVVPISGLVNPITESNLGYVQPSTATGTTFKVCVDVNSNTTIRQLGCNPGEISVDTFII